MADTDEFEEFDEDYEAMEAEAEELSKPASKPAAMNANINKQAPIQMAPPKIGRRGRPPKVKVNPTQAQTARQQQDVEEFKEADEGFGVQDKNQPKWVAYHQPEEIGIINLETRETIKGFKDEGSATAQAKVLNELNVLIIGGGYQ